MTNRERETFCRIAAGLLYPPDQELVQLIEQGSFYVFFELCVSSVGSDQRALEGFRPQGQDLLPVLRKEYDRLFAPWNKEAVPLVESCYKPWTKDRSCSLPFASETGLLMGDPALHLLEVYRRCGLEVREEFKGYPDHLVLELEFLSYLYGGATDREIRQFIADHLDWIPLLREECEKLRPHPFYRSAIEIVSLFLANESSRMEIKIDGRKNEGTFFKAHPWKPAPYPGLREG